MAVTRHIFASVLVSAFALGVCAPLWAEISPSPEPTQQIAKLPDPAHTDAPRAVGSQEPSAETVSRAAGDLPARGAETRKEIAQLSGRYPPASSAADLMELALECDWSWDYAGKIDVLLQLATAYPGTSAAGRALVLAARTDYELGQREEAEALFSRVRAEYPDAEIQVFARAAAELGVLVEAKDFARAEALLIEVAEGWSGTELGRWAALQLGVLHRDYMDDYQGAIPYYQAAAAAYPDSLVAEEAEVSIADCIAWSDTHLSEPQEVYRSAFEHVTNSRLKTRALLGLADMLSEARDAIASYEIVAEFLDEYPDSPAAPIAKAIRSYAASQLGYFEVAVDDAASFLDTPAARNKHPWLHYAYQVLAQDAFRAGRVQQAQDYFTLQSEVAPESALKARAIAGIGHCRAALGDLRGATAAFIEAADAAAGADKQGLYLYEAVCAAGAARDLGAERLIMARMIEEAPGSYLTSRLVGYDLLPPAEPSGGGQ